MQKGLNIGQMDSKIWVERASKKSINDIGEAPPVYNLLNEFFAAVEYLAGSENEKEGVKIAQQRVKFTVKSLNPFQTTDRIGFDGKYWDVEKTYPVGRNNFYAIEAVTRFPLEGGAVIPVEEEEE